MEIPVPFSPMKNRGDRVLIILMVAMGMVSIWLWPRWFPAAEKQAGWDEESYTWVACSIRLSGANFLKAFGKSFMTDDKTMHQVAPNRVLLPLWLGWGWQDPEKVTVRDVRGRMNTVRAGWLILCGLICWKELGRRRGLLAFVFLASSPLFIGTGQRVWADWLLGLWLTAALWGAWRWWNDGKIGWWWLILICGLLAAATKETTMLYLGGSGFLLGWLSLVFWWNRRKGTSFKQLGFFWVAWVLVAASLGIWLTWLYGGIFPFIERTGNIATANLFSRAFSGGPWFRYAVDELLINPLVCLLAIGTLLGFNRDVYPSPWRAWFWSVIAVFSILPFKDLRYLCLLDLPLAMAAATQVAVWSQRRGKIFGLALAIFIFGSELYQAQKIFVDTKTYGVNTYDLIRADGFLGPPSKKSEEDNAGPSSFFKHYRTN